MKTRNEFRGTYKNADGKIFISKVSSIDWMHDEVYFELGADVAQTIEESNLIQYTGLKDKNGVKIFEGDICNIKSRGKQSNQGYVKYDEKYGQYVFMVKTFGKNIEILGNIHENPELLDN